MRILIVDVNFEYKNPMYRQFYTALMYNMEVDFLVRVMFQENLLKKELGHIFLKKENMMQ